MNTSPTTRFVKLISFLIIAVLLAGIRGVAQSSNGGGYALNFDGADDYVDFGTSDLFDFGTGDFSIELWVNYADLASGTGHQVLIEKFTDGYGPGWSF